MTILAAAIILIFAAYSIIILSYWFAWKSCLDFQYSAENGNVFVSVVIAYKDEEATIGELLNDLKSQNYNKDFFEIILVNDHSTDNSLNICKSFQQQIKNLSITNIPENCFGKKKALKHGISIAKGNLILTTDADCSVSINWITSFSNYYLISKNKLIIGSVLLKEPKGMVQKFFELEQISITASTAGSVILGHPIMCSGANLAFEKEIYNTIVNKMAFQVPSGDDMFLLMAIKKKWPENIGFLKSSDAIVYTKPEQNLFKYIQQRRRWISKSKFYTDRHIIGVALIVAITNFCLFVSVVITFFNIKALIICILLFATKIIVDSLLVHSVLKFYNKKNIFRYFILAQIAYPFYVVFIGIYGKFGKYKWKGRLYKT
jgi:glycosyltransferase involved in cell wall biosynthesis